ncbi:RNA polymerase sigma factor [Oerskovia rustica]|uniref:RNA polymerase sigma factor n=1 Tax=Oerskovia rustica TaxID=2762237 RepID=A0ABR8RX11_9CELL|nr:RNA polymerase sigma factor [Oerskovia rustica]MBD7952336.1 RNA polymerase sigma factor [Oerskovia rustica]
MREQSSVFDEGSVAEVDLWSRVQEGDEQAFAVVYRRYSRRVHGLCRALLTSGGLHDDVTGRCEDLTSGVFLAAWRRRREMVVHDSVLPWLLATAANLCSNEQRAARRHRWLVARVAQLHGRAAPSADGAEASVLASILAGRARREIAALPSALREVADLCILHDVTTRDAAAFLEVPEGTVKSRLHRARRHLGRAVLDR